jgi:hypothetical protein
MKKNNQTKKEEKTKKSKEGYCNICKQYSQLTLDHIPPKSCGNNKALKVKTPSTKAIIYQNGLMLPSICGNCNASLLGKKYDKELSKLTNTINRILDEKSLNGLLPETKKLNIEPQLLIRAVVGHILAAGKLQTSCNLPIAGQPPRPKTVPDILRNYFLDPSSNIPDKIDIYYWLYPFDNISVINGLSIIPNEILTLLVTGKNLGLNFLEKEVITSSYLLKFRPLAFWIVWNKPSSFPINFHKISDESREIIIDFQNFPRFDYPEILDEDKYGTVYLDKLIRLGEPKENQNT